MTFPVIDSHQHVWELDAAEYTWLDASSGPIFRSFDLDEVIPEMDAAGVGASILVQSADNAEDTATMVRTADRHPRVVGVVGWVPLDRPDEAAATLTAWEDDDRLVGVRALIHDMADPAWLLRPEVDAGLGVLESRGVPFDLVAVLPEHLELLPVLGERHPDLRIVIDHLAKPPIGGADPEVWRTLMRQAAQNPNVFAKVSGLYAAGGDLTAWTTDLIRPFLDAVVEDFGVNRLMYGGDWPVSILAGGYTRVWGGLRPLFDGFAPGERAALLGETAARFYGISAARLDAATAARGA